VLEISTLVFCVLGILLFFWGAHALLSALIISSVFQAMAFINLGTSPIIVYYFFGILFVLRGALDVFWIPKAWWIPARNSPLFYLLAFVFLAILGAFLSPQVFYGSLVYSPKLSIDEQFNNMTRLGLDTQHFNQSIQLVVNALIFIVIWLRPISPAIFIRAIFSGLLLTIAIAIWQVAANATGVYFPKELLYTVEGWSLGNDQLIGSFTRVNSTFLEPSVFATYLTGIFGFLLVWWVRRPSWMLLLCILLTTGAMLITTSTTAYLGLVCIVACVLCAFGLLQLINGGWMSKSLLAIVLATIAVSWLCLIAFMGSSDIRDLVNLVLLQKSDGDSFRVRIESDLQSFEILWHTYGFGVGLGSNRPSSFFTFLLSNLGILGFIFLGLFLVALTRLALQNTRKLQQTPWHDWAVAGAWGLWATIVAKISAQPDLSFSPMWVWIFFLASLCSASPILLRGQRGSDLVHSPAV
jgi:hypothetical protein